MRPLAALLFGMSLLMPVSAQATLIGDTITARVFTGAGDTLPSTQFVVAPGAEYVDVQGSPGNCVDVFCITTSFDVAADTISFTHNIVWSGFGGGTIYAKRFLISDLDWNGAPAPFIQDVQVLSSEFASLLEFGPHHVLVELGGAYTGHDGSRSISLQLVFAPEPSTALLLFTGLASLATRCRRFGQVDSGGGVS